MDDKSIIQTMAAKTIPDSKSNFARIMLKND